MIAPVTPAEALARARYLNRVRAAIDAAKRSYPPRVAELVVDSLIFDRSHPWLADGRAHQALIAELLRDEHCEESA